MAREPLSDREKEQIRFLVRALAVIITFVIVASLLVGTVVLLFFVDAPCSPIYEPLDALYDFCA
jgi:hypothetical protein